MGIRGVGATCYTTKLVGAVVMSPWLLVLIDAPGTFALPLVTLLPPVRRFKAGIWGSWLQVAPTWPEMPEGKPVKGWIRPRSHHPLLSSFHDRKDSQVWVSPLTPSLEFISSTPSKAGPPGTQRRLMRILASNCSHPQRPCPQHRSIHSFVREVLLNTYHSPGI